MGEFYENIPTIDEAVAIWKQITPERMNGIPAIGINIHTPGTEPEETKRAMEQLELATQNKKGVQAGGKRKSSNLKLKVKLK